MPLDFSIREFLSEIAALEAITSSFTARESAGVLARLRIALENVRTQRNNAVTKWGIPENEPFRTTVSHGQYERDGNGEHNVFAEISSVWEVGPHGNREAGGASKRFRLYGIASSRVRLLRRDQNGDEEVAMWRMEIGDDNAPGCRFHVQVLGERAEIPFPHSISVPRLPSIMVSPMSVIEYVVGELFQDEWPREASRGGASMDLWRSIQTERFIRLMNWQRAAVQTNVGSPWLSLKMAEISHDLFSA